MPSTINSSRPFSLGKAVVWVIVFIAVAYFAGQYRGHNEAIADAGVTTAACTPTTPGTPQP